MKANQILVELTRRYTEPHRHYHNIEHIAYALDLGRELPLSDEQILGLWFHDAVFDVHSSTNEEDSARLADELLGAGGYPRASIEIVRQIVLDTKHHEPTIEPEYVVEVRGWIRIVNANPSPEISEDPNVI